MRLPKQVLIIPYRIINNQVEYGIFKRKDIPIWQWISGGLEDSDKDILAAVKRELYEETYISIDDDKEIIELEGFTKIPVINIVKDFIWGDNVFYSEEYAFAINLEDKEIKISDEHSEYKWISYEESKELLRYDSNKSALWELNEKIKRGIIK